MTSGEGGILPRGLPVGLYSSTLNKNKEKLNILPAKNWDKLSILNVILYNYEQRTLIKMINFLKKGYLYKIYPFYYNYFTNFNFLNNLST